MTNKNNNKNGYTIIETMIAISVFLVVIMTGMGSLLNANLLHQKSQDMRSIIDGLSFMMEDISRNVRTGYNYHCFTSSDTIPSSTSSIVSTPKSGASCWAIAFESDTGDSTTLDGDPADDNDQWVYYISGGDLFKSTQGPYAPANFIQLNSDEVVISGISGFSVLGAEAPLGNLQQPFITIRLSGTITFKNVVTPFSLQTSASQRLIDI